MAPRVLGIVNLTEDSFSDGGLYLEPERALEHARRLHAAGAFAVDLGAASSHPDARRVSPPEEIARLAPVVAALAAEGVRVSIDSCQVETQSWALERDVALLNDIRGFPEPDAIRGLARAGTRLIVMHSITGGERATLDRPRRRAGSGDRPRRRAGSRAATDAEAVLEGAVAFFDARVRALERAGVARERLVLDPGMGFFLGDRPEPSLHMLRALPELRARYGLPLLVSVSRKSFLGALTGRAPGQRGAGTLAAELFAVGRGVEFVRTHDVAALHDALRVLEALGAPLFSPP